MELAVEKPVEPVNLMVGAGKALARALAPADVSLVLPKTDKPVVEAELKKGCRHCLGTPGYTKMLYKDQLPGQPNVRVNGTVRMQVPCQCVMNNAQRIARARGIQGDFTVKVKGQTL